MPQQSFTDINDIWARLADIDRSLMPRSELFVSFSADLRQMYISMPDSGNNELIYGDIKRTITCLTGDGIMQFCETEPPASLSDSGAMEYIASSEYRKLFFGEAGSLELQTLSRYYEYAVLLQRLYRSLMYFCCDAGFYREDLSGITAATRYYLFCLQNEITMGMPLKSSLEFRRVVPSIDDMAGAVFSDKVFYFMPQSAVKQYEETCQRVVTEGRTEKNSLERDFDLPVTFTELNAALPAVMHTEYHINTLEQLLYLEFINMLELDLRIKRCKNCGRYFALKGNYQTEYCDKYPEGEQKSCQSIAATSKYADKVKASPALGIYNKYYKRIHARKQTGSVTKAQFDKWKKDASKMRDSCDSGGMLPEQFEKWLSELDIK